MEETKQFIKGLLETLEPIAAELDHTAELIELLESEFCLKAPTSDEAVAAYRTARLLSPDISDKAKKTSSDLSDVIEDLYVQIRGKTT